ncbi:MAG: DUF4230 domain-containing protein [bacterium]|nr:DUF4230 domain-containing protein [bacterium]
MHRIYLLFAIVFLLVIGMIGYFSLRSPYSFNRDHTAVVKEIRELNRLESATFTIEKIIEGGKDGNVLQDLLYGDRILFIAHGEVIAGVDLSSIADDAIKIEGKKLTVQLPKPEIFFVALNNEKSRVYDRQQGILNRGDKDLEGETRKVAEESIRKAACEANILNISGENAKKQLTKLFTALAFEDVTVQVPQGSC